MTAHAAHPEAARASVCWSSSAGRLVSASPRGLAAGMALVEPLLGEPGLEPMMAYYGLLDRTPMGRNEDDSQPVWLRCHDEC
jgi:hypothetical protein